VFLGSVFLSERLTTRANQFARGASVCENLVTFKRRSTTTCGLAARCRSSRCRKVTRCLSQNQRILNQIDGSWRGRITKDLEA
jgi:hypothetical protein